MKATFYGHFVAGEDEEKIRPVIERLRSFGVKSILDYSAEEDISEEKAVEVEMSSSVPKSATGTIPGTPLANTELKQFKPQKDFADRRKFKATARTYFYMNEAQCERNMETFLKCIDAVAGVTSHTGLAAVKLTALGRPQILLQLSEVIARTRMLFREVTGEDKNMVRTNITPHEFQEKYKKRFDVKFNNPEVEQWFKHMDFDRRGLLNLFSWNGLVDMTELASDVFKVPNLQSGKMENIIKALSHEEDEMFRNMMRRINVIAQAAKEKDVRVMVDAEQSYLQPAINRITVELMRKYNLEKAIIFNTYQCYMKVRRSTPESIFLGIYSLRMA
jgi:proline dehydrogenase